jgi:cytochrome c oxidase assembly protein subunit 15
MNGVLRFSLLAAVIALGPLAWWWLRHRGSDARRRLHGLTLLTLFLTFDLVLFGAFTRLTDSGLGCPDWPGCYGSASPFGASEHIEQAQAALPSGPVTHQKAWIEMVHRYLAAAVGVLIIVMTLASWWMTAPRSSGTPIDPPRGSRPASGGRAPGEVRRGDIPSPWWPTATLVWVCLQGAFGALTVTMKLYPAIVTAHLLGGLALLALLAAQDQVFAPRPLALPRALWRGAWAVALLTVVQIALGGWVSTNYAVLACTDFPTCHGSWWPAMDFTHGFAFQRELGSTADGGWLPFAALTAIHYTHRLAAYVVLAALALLAWRLHAAGQPRFALGFALVALWQLASGLSNVVLGWPLVAAVAHTGGAAALVMLLTALLARARPQAARAETAARPLRKIALR